MDDNGATLVAQSPTNGDTGVARREVRAWVRSQIKDQSVVDMSTLYRELIVHFSHDQEFIDLWLTETLPAIAYEETRRVIGETRGHVMFGDQLLSRAATDVRLRAARPRWQAWLENVGDRKQKLVMDMNASELLFAAELREARGESEYRVAALWREMRSYLLVAGPDATVRDVFKPEEIDRLAESLHVEISATRTIVIRDDTETPEEPTNE